MIEKDKNNILLFVISFFSFLGYYWGAMLTLGLGFKSENISILIRLIICICFTILFLKNIYERIHFTFICRCFLIYSMFYVARIFIDVIYLEEYYLTEVQLSFYFISFALIPFSVFSMFEFNNNDLNVIFKGISVSCILLTLSTVIFYGKYLGKYGRLGAGTTEDVIISPLVLSYCSVLIIGVLSTYLIFNKVSVKEKLIYLISCVLSIIPLFLGASRGSLIALIVPFCFILLFRNNFKNLAIGILSLSVGLFLINILGDIFSSSLLERFSQIDENIRSESSSAIRIKIWKEAFEQFLNNPLLGDKLRLDSFDSHPHNIILEVLLTTGIVGFIPFSILLLFSFKACAYLVRNYIQHSWLVVIYLQSFIQNLFSGATYTAVWFWTSMAIVLSFYYQNKIKLPCNNIQVK